MIFETNEFLWIKSSYDTTKENNLHELLIAYFAPKYPVRIRYKSAKDTMSWAQAVFVVLS